MSGAGRVHAIPKKTPTRAGVSGVRLPKYNRGAEGNGRPKRALPGRLLESEAFVNKLRPTLRARSLPHRLLRSRKFNFQEITVLVHGQTACVNLALFQAYRLPAYPANLGSFCVTTHTPSKIERTEDEHMPQSVLRLYDAVRYTPGNCPDRHGPEPLLASLVLCFGRCQMTPEERERMQQLFQRITVEKDPEIFDQLVKELNDLLEARHARIHPEQKTKTN